MTIGLSEIGHSFLVFFQFWLFLCALAETALLFF